MAEPLILVLTHDVDWGRRGPSDIHILDRWNRFSFEDKLRFFTFRENLYDCVNMIMEYEYRQGIRSTFFFRYLYDDNTTAELYSDTLSELVRHGWEVGLHSNNGRDLDSIKIEKNNLERVAGIQMKSLRVHNLAIDPRIVPRLKTIGIEIDSSFCFSKESASIRSVNCMLVDGVIELPITVMDTYMFSYWRVDPDKAYTTLVALLKKLHHTGARIATVLWHTNSVKMIGGKDYLKFVESIWSFEWLQPVRAIDIVSYSQSVCVNMAGKTLRMRISISRGA